MLPKLTRGRAKAKISLVWCEDRVLLVCVIVGALILPGCAALATKSTERGGPLNSQTFSFSGKWSGMLIQPDSPASPYGAELTLVNDQTADNKQVNDVVGLIEYPDLACGGYLTLAESGFPIILLKETITHGRCVNNGIVKLKAAYDDGVYFQWYMRPGTSAASVYGPLSRDRSRSYSVAEVARRISAYKAVEQAEQQNTRRLQARKSEPNVGDTVVGLGLLLWGAAVAGGVKDMWEHGLPEPDPRYEQQMALEKQEKICKSDTESGRASCYASCEGKSRHNREWTDLSDSDWTNCRQECDKGYNKARRTCG